MSTTQSASVAPRGPVVSGQRVRNLATGETMTFRRTSSESNGQLVEFDLELRPLGVPGGAPHRHFPVERFRITAGVLCVWIGLDRPRIAYAGDVVEIPSHQWHFLLALRPSTARVSVTPGMRFDELLVESAALGSGDVRPEGLRRIVPLLREHGCI